MASLLSRNTQHAIRSTLFLLAFALPAFAQTNDLPSAPLHNRYLLVVETTRSMQRRVPGTLNALTNLLASGFHGQIHAGDTLGVWTFNEDLYTGQFPLQRWSAQDQAVISKRVLDFLGAQQYEQQPNFDKLLSALNQLVKNSPFITIVLVTDGQDKLRGTPFDSRINDLYDDWRGRQQETQMPFLTVLRGKRGVILDYAVAPAPWPLDMPPLPKELRVPDVATQRAAAKPALADYQALPAADVATQKAAAKPVPIVPSLIVRGKKPDPAMAAAPEGTNPAVAPVVAASRPLPQPAPSSAAAPGPVSPAQPVAAPATNPAPSAFAVTAPTPQPGAMAAANPPAPASAPVAGPAVSSASARNALAQPTAAPAHRKLLWPAALLVAGALLGLALWLFRRARPAPTASLITRSLERQSK